MKKAVLLLFFLLFGVVGYLRERFFEHMNIIMAGVYRGTDEYTPLHMKMPWIMTPFSKLSYPVLYYSKYPFTLAWVVLFYIISLFALKNLTGERKNIVKILTLSYTVLLILAGISMVYGYLVNATLKNDEYTISRWLLGIAQSPLICLILLAAQKINSKKPQL